MALIRLNNGREVAVPAEKANAVWEVLNGDKPGTDEQQRYCMTVRRVWLNWRNPSTPYSYLQTHKDTIIGLARMHGVYLPELTSPGVDRLTLASQGDK
jgi:hypothetical protein